MNSDYHELMGVSRLLAAAEERIEELEADLENAESYVAELEGRDPLLEDQKLEGMLADLEFEFTHTDLTKLSKIESFSMELINYLRSKGVVRLS